VVLDELPDDRITVGAAIGQPWTIARGLMVRPAGSRQVDRMDVDGRFAAALVRDRLKKVVRQ